MHLLPHGTGVDFDWCGPKWINGIGLVPRHMMRIVELDVSGLPGHDIYVRSRHGQTLQSDKPPFDDDALLELVPHLKRLEELKGLNLYNTSITDNGLMALRDLDHLDWLVVASTQLSMEAIRGLAQANPQITIMCDIGPARVPYTIYPGEAWRQSKLPKAFRTSFTN